MVFGRKQRGFYTRQLRYCVGPLAMQIAQGAIRVEQLNAAIGAIANLDVALGVVRDGVQNVELPRLLAAFAPRLEPTSILVDLHHA